MTLAHIRSGAVVKRFTNPAKITLADGRRVHSPAEGFADGADKVVPVVLETVGTAGPDVEITQTEVVEASRVLVTTTHRPLTQQEIDARAAAETTAALDRVFATDKDMRAVMLVMRDLAKAIRDGNLSGLTDQQITNQMRARFEFHRGS